MKSKPSAVEYTTVNQVKLIHAGKEFFDKLLELIHKATESIHIQMYIFDDDETGQMVVDALKLAVQRKVAVYLLADGYASQSLTRQFIDDLRIAGIHFRYFEPLLKSKYFYLGRRLHHKLVVVDTRWALVGGVNISNRYNDMPDQPAWLDFALYVEGEIALPLCVLCWKAWKGYPSYMNITPCEEKKINFEIPEENRSRVRMRRNDWVRRKNQITATYLQMLNGAKTKVIILCSYFLPGRAIRNSLRKAVKRGVIIKVVMAGRSDVMIAKRAERWYYDWLLRNGLELYEYQKNILHGKLATADDSWMTIGSFNVNDISTYASIELNLDVDDPGVTRQTREMLEEIMQKDCIRITQEQYARSKNMFQQFLNWLSYRTFRTIFFLFTFYFKQEH
jgi:cardiolipin synthase A/B